MGKTIVFIPDTHIPVEDRKATAALIRFIGEYKPDEVVHIGDLMDFPAPSRWSKGTAEEFAKNQLPEDIDAAKRRFLEPLRAAYDGPVGVIEGNHDERPRVYLSKYAPAVSAYDFYHLDNLLDFDSFGFSMLPDFYDFAPGWVATHGHKGGIRLTQQAGLTALNAAVKFGKNVLHGHTHRLGKQMKSSGYDGSVTLTTGVEVGHITNQKMMGYLKGGTANWQQGFAVARIDGRHVDVQPIAITDKRFVVDGVSYSTT